MPSKHVHCPDVPRSSTLSSPHLETQPGPPSKIKIDKICKLNTGVTKFVAAEAAVIMSRRGALSRVMFRVMTLDLIIFCYLLYRAKHCLHSAIIKLGTELIVTLHRVSRDNANVSLDFPHLSHMNFKGRKNEKGRH